MDTEIHEACPDMDYYMAEMIAYPSAGDDGAVRLSLGHLHRTQSPVVLDIGPVMAVPDLIAWKVAALVARAEIRDFIDVAVFLADRDPDALPAMARQVDPALEDEDVARAGRRLDQTPDRAFAPYKLGQQDIAQLWARFAGWLRGPRSS